MAGSSGRSLYSEQFDIIATSSSAIELCEPDSSAIRRRRTAPEQGSGGGLTPTRRTDETAAEMSEGGRSFEDVTRDRAVEPALPIDDYLRELDALVAAHDYFAEDRVTPAIGAGRASRDVVRRVALEYYYLGK